VSHATPTPEGLRREVGSAVWLLFLFFQFVPADWTGETSANIANGNLILDFELAQRLAVSIAAVQSQLCKLRRLGLVGWAVPAGVDGRVFWLTPEARLPFEFRAPAQRPTEPQLAQLARTSPAIWCSIQERSIAISGKCVEDLNEQEKLHLADALTGDSKNPVDATRTES